MLKSKASGHSDRPIMTPERRNRLPTATWRRNRKSFVPHR